MAFIVDTHMHLLAEDLVRYPLAPIGGQQSPWSKGASLTPEQFIAMMDAGGVARATVVQASTSHGYDNRYTADSVDRYRDRFVGVVCTDPLAPDAPDTLSYWIKDRGMRGVRLFTTGGSLPETYWLDQPETAPFFQRARELGIPVDIQIKRTGIGMVVNLVKRFGDVPLVLDHMAGPRLEDGPPYHEAQALLDLAQYPNIYLKYSTDNLREAAKGQSTPRDLLRTLIDRFGPNRMMWCSNFPASKGETADPFGSLVKLAQDTLAFASPGEQAWLLGETAVSLYPDLRKP